MRSTKKVSLNQLKISEMIKYEKQICLYFEKNSNKTLMGMKDPFEISRNRANFTKNLIFLPKTLANAILGYKVFFNFFQLDVGRKHDRQFFRKDIGRGRKIRKRQFFPKFSIFGISNGQMKFEYLRVEGPKYPL